MIIPANRVTPWKLRSLFRMPSNILKKFAHDMVWIGLKSVTNFDITLAASTEI
jgi:hypothetical protein